MANTTINNGTVNTVVEDMEVTDMGTMTQKDIDAIANGETVVEDMEVTDMSTMTQEDINEIMQEEYEAEILKKVGNVEVMSNRFKVTTDEGCEFNIFITPMVGYVVYVGDIEKDDKIKPSVISSIDKVVSYCNSIEEKVKKIKNKEEKDMSDVKLTQVLKDKVEEIREDLANGGSDMFNDIKEGLDGDAKTIASAFGMATQSLSKVFDGGEISLFLHEYINTIRNNGIAGVFSGEKVLVDRIYKLGEKYVANGKMDKLEDAMAFECGDNTQGVVGSLASLVAWTLIHAKASAKKLFGGVVEDNEIIKKLVEGASAIIGVVKAGISIVFNIGVRVITFATAVVTKAVMTLLDAVKYLYNKIKTYAESKKSNEVANA